MELANKWGKKKSATCGIKYSFTKSADAVWKVQVPLPHSDIQKWKVVHTVR
jgi:hypothetical protein